VGKKLKNWLWGDINQVSRVSEAHGSIRAFALREKILQFDCWMKLKGARKPFEMKLSSFYILQSSWLCNPQSFWLCTELCTGPFTGYSTRHFTGLKHEENRLSKNFLQGCVQSQNPGSVQLKYKAPITDDISWIIGALLDKCIICLTVQSDRIRGAPV
jgi:hypothetical protein